ncbi:hypothetical protein AB0J82_20975 [Asanoa sp. NPDC049518]|uniref:hypothetical protein n=1 Tax=unclassified Asanoa TaxID=2685164 RepID=UPI0034420446
MSFRLDRAVGHAADVATSLFTSAALETLIMKAGLARFQPLPRAGDQRYAKTQLVASTTHAAVAAVVRKHDPDTVDALKEFVRLVAQRASNQQLASMVEAVRAAGFDLVDVDGEMRLLPLDEPASPLSQAITALDADLDRAGLTVARRHYRQAVESLVDGRAEAANGQMRTMLEEVIVQAAVVQGFTRKRQGEGGKALAYLIQSDALPMDDGGEYIHGLWAITHTNGPHPGTSPAGEAQFRVQALTSAARYLVDRFLSLKHP